MRIYRCDECGEPSDSLREVAHGEYFCEDCYWMWYDDDVGEPESNLQEGKTNG